MGLSAGDRDLVAGWDAVEVAERIRRRDVRADEVIDAAVRRAEAVAGLNAVFASTYDQARTAVVREERSAAFFGVPTFVKDLAQVEGVPTTWGSAASGRYVSRSTDPIVKRIAEIGLVSLGKSACPELGLTPATEPVGRPPCRNPWNPAYSSGGSSGGAAVLVAAGVVPLAHASDGGGSIRIPAACCGLVGLKPSRGRLDMLGSNLLPINIATDGVVTRSVRDTVAFYEALEHGRTGSLPPIGPMDDRARPLRISFFVDSPLGLPVDSEVKRAVRAAARLCEELGHHVDEVSCPFSSDVVDDFLRYWGLLAWLQVRSGRIAMHRNFQAKNVEPWTKGLIHLFLGEKRAALATIPRLRRFRLHYDDVLARCDVLISPTVGTPPPLLGHLAPHVPFDTAVERVRAYATFTPLHNTSGAPALSLPLGRSGNGLPIGVQFASAHGRDRVLLHLARSLERVAPWPTVAPVGNPIPSEAA